MAQVILEAEVRVIDPHRAPAVQRREGELVAIARDQMQAPADLLEELLGGRRAAPSMIVSPPTCMCDTGPS